MNDKIFKSKQPFSGFRGSTLLFLMIAIWPRICSAHRSPEMGEERNAKGEPALDIVGFNYTDRVIDSFSVNGNGAGNIFLSTQTSGGGKSACCFRLPGASEGIAKLRIKWQVDGCVYVTKSRISSEIFENLFYYYKEVEVDVIRSKKFVPQHLEIHFYPNGTVRAQLTAELSLPRMLLDGKRSDNSNFPRCPHDKKPD